MHNVGITTSIGAELWCVKSGLEMAWDLSFQKDVLELESEIMAKAIITKRGSLASHGGVLADIHGVLASLVKPDS